ncbi:MAG: hypothetical protein ACI9UA_005887 [Pseudoalteromonas tetraodonis]|jgi:hypothetical protein
MVDLSRALYAGRFTGKGTLLTSEGEFFLSGVDDGVGGALREFPFPGAMEREGQYVLIKAARKRNSLWLCEIIEEVGPITSRLLDRMLEESPALKKQLVAIVCELHTEARGEPVETDHTDPLARSISGPRPICALVVGHRKGAKGASGIHGGKSVNEWDFNCKLAERIAQHSTMAEVLIIHRDNTVDGYVKLPAKINRLNPKFIISLHANAADKKVGGTETLFFESSGQGKKLAKVVQKHLLMALGLTERTLKPVNSSGRGGTLLAGTYAPAVIGEPFFIDNPSDLKRAMGRKEKLAKAYAAAIDEWASKLSQGGRARGGRSGGLKTSNRTKPRFLSDNRVILLPMISAVNGRLEEQYGQGFMPLTKLDFWVLFNSEAGLDEDGHVDPEHRHSEGERGILPLPKNVRVWNGDSAPRWNLGMSADRNVDAFMMYLGQLKNKPMRTEGRLAFYRDAFQKAGIRGNGLRQARLLSGVVHGYLYDGNFSDKVVPVTRILNGFAKDKSIPSIMDPTAYRYAGQDILANREKNIREAVAML